MSELNVVTRLNRRYSIRRAIRVWFAPLGLLACVSAPALANTWSGGSAVLVTDPPAVVHGSGSDTSASGPAISIAAGSTTGDASKSRTLSKLYTYNGSFPHTDRIYVNLTGRIKGNVSAADSGAAAANASFTISAHASYDNNGQSNSCGLSGNTSVNGSQTPPYRNFDKTPASPGQGSTPIESVWKEVMYTDITASFSWTLSAGGSVGIYNGHHGPYSATSTASSTCQTTTSL